MGIGKVLGILMIYFFLVVYGAYAYKHNLFPVNKARDIYYTVHKINCDIDIVKLNNLKQLSKEMNVDYLLVGDSSIDQMNDIMQA